MITPQLHNWALAKGYRLVHGDREESDMVECPMNGYVFSLSNEIDNSKSSMIGVLFGAVGTAIASSKTRGYMVRLAVDHSTWNSQALKEIKKALKGIATPTYAKNLLTLTLKATAHNDETYQAAEYCMYQVATVVAQKGVRAPGVCQFCHSAGCDTYSPAQKGFGHLLPAHTACEKTWREKALNKLVKTFQKPSFFRALPWLLLGVLVGLIVPVILPLVEIYMLLNMFFYALIPVCAFSFYQNHGGRMNFFAFLLVFVLTAAAIVALVVWGDFHYVRAEYELIPFADYVWVLTDPDYLAGVLFELVLGWVAGLVGILIGWFTSRSKRKKNLARIQAMSYSLGQPEMAMNAGEPVPAPSPSPAAVQPAQAAQPSPAAEPQFGIGFDE